MCSSDQSKKKKKKDGATDDGGTAKWEWNQDGGEEERGKQEEGERPNANHVASITDGKRRHTHTHTHTKKWPLRSINTQRAPAAVCCPKWPGFRPRCGWSKHRQHTVNPLNRRRAGGEGRQIFTHIHPPSFLPSYRYTLKSVDARTHHAIGKHLQKVSNTLTTRHIPVTTSPRLPRAIAYVRQAVMLLQLFRS